MNNSKWHNEVLAFWFDELKPGDWFSVNAQTDATIRARFAGLHERLMQNVPAAALLEPEPALAAVIVLDQFSRNMYRATGKAFASDPLALALARAALAGSLDQQLDAVHSRFLFMPFMHSEHLADQERCVELFQTQGGDSLKYAIEHRDIIARFGRFPHRNKVLGRETTAEEKAFLNDHEGYGQ
ncbi:DUF924 family protein [Mesorhizobium sp. NBSH29]|uniref:DUF924 family protein n=1 Tax=Mesorhizobium sp. NBSH29 TaxID=2654249 RepID=UPI0018965C2F|nr:DUF924 family protein [Mesorhizobium sp. NBSH29]QPC86675.1 DUF924 family protein [Mesorhizobium sp. NBSH29]